MFAERKNVQVVLLGMQRVGKTALLKRVLDNRFDAEYRPTEAPGWRDWSCYTEDGSVGVLVKDAPGSVSLSPTDLTTATGLLIVYDCTNPESFSYAGELVHRIPRSYKKVLVAAKCDEMYRRVTTAQGQAFARNAGVKLVETSAKRGEGTRQAFETVVAAVRRKGEDESGVPAPLRDLSIEEVREVLSSSLEIDNSHPRTFSTYSPPLVLTPDSPDSYLESEQPDELALVEEHCEGRSVLGLVRMDVQTSEMGTQTEVPEAKRRNPRPATSTKKKEELDKFWLRQFRKYMKHNYASIKSTMSAVEKTFWKRYLSPEMKPDKDRLFKSYSKKYKAHLFQHPQFATQFRQWFQEEGGRLLTKRFDDDQASYDLYYQHAVTALLEADSREEPPESFDPDDFILKY